MLSNQNKSLTLSKQTISQIQDKFQRLFNEYEERGQEGIIGIPYKHTSTIQSDSDSVVTTRLESMRPLYSYLSLPSNDSGKYSQGVYRRMVAFFKGEGLIKDESDNGIVSWRRERDYGLGDQCVETMVSQLGQIEHSSTYQLPISNSSNNQNNNSQFTTNLSQQLISQHAQSLTCYSSMEELKQIANSLYIYLRTIRKNRYLGVTVKGERIINSNSYQSNILQNKTQNSNNNHFLTRFLPLLTPLLLNSLLPAENIIEIYSQIGESIRDILVNCWEGNINSSSKGRNYDDSKLTQNWSVVLAILASAIQLPQKWHQRQLLNSHQQKSLEKLIGLLCPISYLAVDTQNGHKIGDKHQQVSKLYSKQPIISRIPPIMFKMVSIILNKQQIQPINKNQLLLIIICLSFMFKIDTQSNGIQQDSLINIVRELVRVASINGQSQQVERIITSKEKEGRMFINKLCELVNILQNNNFYTKEIYFYCQYVLFRLVILIGDKIDVRERTNKLQQQPNKQQLKPYQFPYPTTLLTHYLTDIQTPLHYSLDLFDRCYEFVLPQICDKTNSQETSSVERYNKWLPWERLWTIRSVVRRLRELDRNEEGLGRVQESKYVAALNKHTNSIHPNYPSSLQTCFHLHQSTKSQSLSYPLQSPLIYMDYLRRRNLRYELLVQEQGQWKGVREWWMANGSSSQGNNQSGEGSNKLTSQIKEPITMITLQMSVNLWAFVSKMTSMNNGNNQLTKQQSFKLQAQLSTNQNSSLIPLKSLFSYILNNLTQFNYSQQCRRNLQLALGRIFWYELNLGRGQISENARIMMVEVVERMADGVFKREGEKNGSGDDIIDGNVDEKRGHQPNSLTHQKGGKVSSQSVRDPPQSPPLLLALFQSLLATLHLKNTENYAHEPQSNSFPNNQSLLPSLIESPQQLISHYYEFPNLLGTCSQHILSHQAYRRALCQYVIVGGWEWGQLQFKGREGQKNGVKNKYQTVKSSININSQNKGTSIPHPNPVSLLLKRWTSCQTTLSLLQNMHKIVHGYRQDVLKGQIWDQEIEMQVQCVKGVTIKSYPFERHLSLNKIITPNRLSSPIQLPRLIVIASLLEKPVNIAHLFKTLVVSHSNGGQKQNKSRNRSKQNSNNLIGNQRRKNDNITMVNSMIVVPSLTMWKEVEKELRVMGWVDGKKINRENQENSNGHTIPNKQIIQSNDLQQQQQSSIVPQICIVPPQQQLHHFIREWKAVGGYKVMALEQCVSSQVLGRKGDTKNDAHSSLDHKTLNPSKRNNPPTILILGNQKLGTPSSYLKLADKLVEIPQIGQIRSLNVQVSAVVCLWEMGWI